MSKKLHISLIFSNEVVFKTLSQTIVCTTFIQIRQNTRDMQSNSLNLSSMNPEVMFPRRGPVPKFSGFGSGGAILARQRPRADSEVVVRL